MRNSKLYVGNLSYQLSEEELRKAFEPYGEVVSVNIIPGKGFGFVEMATPEEAEQAKEALNNTILAGRPMRVEEARPRKQDFRKRGY